MLSIVQRIELRISRMDMKRIFIGLGAIGAACALTACSAGDAGSDGSDDSSLRIFATTGYLADAAQNIAPDACVFTIVRPGGDPHRDQPSTKDIEKMHVEDLVLGNGHTLAAQVCNCQAFI